MFCKGEARRYPSSQFTQDPSGRWIHNVSPPHFTDGFAVNPGEDPNAAWIIPDSTGFRAPITSRIIFDANEPDVLRIEAPETDLASPEAMRFQQALRLYQKALEMPTDQLQALMERFVGDEDSGYVQR